MTSLAHDKKKPSAAKYEGGPAMQPKSGIRTTEFWVNALTIVGLVVAAIATPLSPRYAAICAAVSSAAYAISRGLAKLNQPKSGP